MVGRPTSIPNQQTPMPAQPTRSARETELEQMIPQYQIKINELLDKNYLASLKDDTFFRLELLTALNNIGLVFKSFLDELRQSQGEQTQ